MLLTTPHSFDCRDCGDSYAWASQHHAMDSLCNICFERRAEVACKLNDVRAAQTRYWKLLHNLETLLDADLDSTVDYADADLESLMQLSRSEATC